MPATRKSARSAGGGAHGKQSTLSFNHRVTKSGAAKSVKDTTTSAKTSGLSKEYVPQAEEKETETETDKTKPLAVQDVVVTEEEEVEDKVEDDGEEVVVKDEEKSEAELKAEKISNAAIERYWSKIDDARLAKAVHKKHTEGLTTGEKVLRYFDVSSQYGPCVGITRLKRWQRAERLGLKPPIEVLAVLLKENRGSERAHMDELLNAATVGA
ncbi:DNA polymerase delta subunit 4 [Echria macrotheca]|uniref:DNA polymerase delta subunit 4 n=1 Tax=Echria macrotheca TaxID=438768 RepID=A0AAJ0BCH7_9PEZI|nr:DNA polymerase delta subunit 4 [Echria macrotheca]